MKKIFPLTMAVLLIAFSLLSLGAYLRGDAELLAAQQRSQILLARQSAKTLETLFTGHFSAGPLAVESLLEQTAGALPPELAVLGLFDLDEGRMLHAPAGLTAAENFPELRERLSRGGFGSMVLEEGGTEALVSFLPVRLGGQSLSLLVLSPLSPGAGLFIGPLPLAGAQSVLALILAFGFGWSWFRTRYAPQAGDAGSKEQTAAEEPPRREVENRSEALRLENLTLQARLWDYQLLVDSADYGMARLSGNGQIQFCSAPFQKLAGQRGHELKGRNLLDLETFDKATRQRLQEAIGGLRDGGSAVTLLADLSANPKMGDALVSLRLIRLQGKETANGLLLTAHPVAAEEALPQASVS